ncbi:S8 family peptidase [bacterium]|nr:S8 family peptidase [bacterium]
MSSQAARLASTELADLPQNQTLRAVLVLGDGPDPVWFEELVEGLPRDERSEVVWQALLEWTEPQMQPLLRELDGRMDVAGVRPLRLANGIALDATPEVLLELMNRPEVTGLLDDRPKLLDEWEWREVVPLEPQVTETDEITWSVEHIGAPQVWAEGIDGSGILIASIDTGVNWHHHDLRNRLWDGGDEFPNHGYDFYDGDLDPMDEAGHGSLVAGILVGDGTSGTRTGVAPGARIMCLRVRSNLSLGTVSDTWAAQDFALEHGADITSMSLGWGNPGEEDREIWRNNYSLLNAAGIVNVKSAGNRRESHLPPESISVPGDVPSPWRNPQENSFGSRSGMITVGGIDRQDNITIVSSPGPVTWQEEAPWFDFPLDALRPGLIKPDVCAPCVDGLSTVYSDTIHYSSFLNTSMAQPHVAGTVALMLSKNPHLLPAQVDSILQTTALDRGVVGKDNNYGAGRIQAWEAVAAVPPDLNAPQVTDPTPQPRTFEITNLAPNPFNSTTRLSVTVSQPTPLTMTITNLLGQIVEERTFSRLERGHHAIDLALSNESSGIYFLILRTEDKRLIRKLMLLR